MKFPLPSAPRPSQPPPPNPLNGPTASQRAQQHNNSSRLLFTNVQDGAKIRKIIWRFVLDDPITITNSPTQRLARLLLPSPADPVPSPDQTKGPHMLSTAYEPPLLRVCTTIRAEAKPLFWLGDRHFVFAELGMPTPQMSVVGFGNPNSEQARRARLAMFYLTTDFWERLRVWVAGIGPQHLASLDIVLPLDPARWPRPISLCVRDDKISVCCEGETPSHGSLLRVSEPQVVKRGVLQMQGWLEDVLERQLGFKD